MSMQTDVKAVQITESGSAFGAPTRVKGLVISFASGGTVEVKDGGASGTSRFKYTAPAAAGAVNVVIPGEGIRCYSNVYVAVSSATAVVFYG